MSIRSKILLVILLAGALVLIDLVLESVSGPPADAATTSCSTRVMIGAHRGAPAAGSGLTENGMPAFQAAWGQSCIDYVEADFRRTIDHQILIMHDATIDRTTNGTGTVSQMTYAQVKKYHLDDGSQIPGEITFLSGLRASGKGADLELKNLGPIAMAKFVDILDDYPDLRTRVRVTSLLSSQLVAFREVTTRYTTALIAYHTSDESSAAKAFGNTVQVGFAGVVANYAGMDIEKDADGSDAWTDATASADVTRILTNYPADLEAYLTAAESGASTSKLAKTYPYTTTWSD